MIFLGKNAASNLLSSQLIPVTKGVYMIILINLLCNNDG